MDEAKCMVGQVNLDSSSETKISFNSFMICSCFFILNKYSSLVSNSPCSPDAGFPSLGGKVS